MAKQDLNIGAAPNDGTGDPLRDAMDKVNDNFNEIYTALGGNTVSNLVSGGVIDFTGSNKLTFLYTDISDLPAASSYHGMFAHAHNQGAAYFAHAGSWIELSNKSDVDALSINNLVDVDTASAAPTDGQVLAWNASNSRWQPAADAGGIALVDLSVSTASAGTAALAYNSNNGVFTYTPPDLSSYIALSDLSVGAEGTASGDGAIAYDNSTGTFTYTPPDLSGYQTIAGLATVATTGQYTDLLNTPTIPSVLTDLSISDGTAGQVLTTDGNGAFSFTTVSGGGSSYTDGDVDTHLNTSTATSGQILSWDGADYAWVADQTSGGGTDTVIAPFAFANVETTANGSGIGISWSNWNSGNGSLDFTFDNAQANTQYTVVTDSETFDDYSVGINTKTTTGFTAEFYDNSGTRAPSNFSPFTIIVYAETPTATITGTSLSNASIGALSDVSISSATTGQVLKYNGSSWVNDTDAGGGGTFGLAGNTGTHTFDTSTETLTFLGTTGQINAEVATNFISFSLDQNINSITSIAFEGATDDGFETTVSATDPTADRAILLPDASGTLALTTDIPTAYTDSDVDAHLNQSNPTSGHVLSWNGSDYAWVAQAGSSTDTLADITARGASTNDAVTINNTLTVNALDSTGLGFANLTSASDIVLNATGDINASSSKITNVLDPTAAQDAATKAYVDSAVLDNVPTMTVTAPDSANYSFTGDGFPSAALNPTLTLYRGFTYHIVINSPGHPFWINSVNGTGQGNAYNDGVTNNGTTNTTISFTVPFNAPATLYYNCEYHSAMNGTINIP